MTGTGDGVRGWWTGRTDAQRFDLYTRGTLHSLLIASTLGALLVSAGAAAISVPAVFFFVGLVCAATVAGIPAIGRGMDHALHGAVLPVRLLQVYAVLAAAAAAAAVIGFPHVGGEIPGGTAAAPALALVAAHVVAVLSPVLISSKLAMVTVGLAAIAGVVATAADWPTRTLVATITSIAFACAGVIVSFRGSVWMLGIVWQLDRSRRIEADLAVAEERLRFSRDLHDVMGRTLSVIAVRSELAAELSRRGRPDAADEMLGVRALAQEGLREMREVVRGYRTVDLAAELAGAGSVLRAAGTTAEVEGDAAALPSAVQSILSWVVREGTTNVIRHTDATRCSFRVTIDGDVAVLTIDNDGTLIADRPPGSGLAGLGERLAAAGGHLTVDDDRDARRFRVTASVPLTAKAATDVAADDVNEVS